MPMERFFGEHISGESGQALAEALVGIALLALGISFGVFFVVGGASVYQDRVHTIRAQALAEEGAAAAATLVFLDWEGAIAGTYGLIVSTSSWAFQSLPDEESGFIRSVVITDLDDFRKEILVRVLWQADSERALFVQIPTIVSRWKDAVESGGAPGGGEDSGLSGDWLHPETISSEDVSPSGRQGTDIALFNDRAYITTTRAGNSASFTVFDVSDPVNPSQIGEFNTGDSLNSLAVTSTYAYVASPSNSKEFIVLDVSNPSGISEAGSLNFSGAEDAVSVFLSGTLAYVGRRAGGAIDEFVIIDVSSPSNPLVLGSVDIGAEVGDVHVLGPRAYLATKKAGEEFMVFDVSNPASPVLSGSFSLQGESDSGAGRSVYAVGPTKIFFGTSARLFVLNAASSSAITPYGSYLVSGSVNDIVAIGRYVFLATSLSTAELLVLDVGDPESISQISSFNYPQDAAGVDFEDNRVYAVVRSNDALRVIGPGN